MINLLKPTGHVMHQQFNIQLLYAVSTLYLCVLCLSENKQRLVPLTQNKLIGFLTEKKSVYCVVRTGSLNKAVCAVGTGSLNKAVCAVRTGSLNKAVCAVRTGSLNKAACASSLKG